MQVRNLLFTTLCLSQCASAQTYLPRAEVFFESIESTIVSEIVQAKESVYVQIFKFNSKPIAQALIEAKKRGLDVVVMVDGKAAKDPKNRAKTLSEAGVPTFVDGDHATMHNKIMIIDRDRVITGSFNYTKKADRKNAENILILTDPKLRDRYFQNWKEHRSHCLGYDEFVKKALTT